MLLSSAGTPSFARMWNRIWRTRIQNQTDDHVELGNANDVGSWHFKRDSLIQEEQDRRQSHQQLHRRVRSVDAARKQALPPSLSV